MNLIGPHNSLANRHEVVQHAKWITHMLAKAPASVNSWQSSPGCSFVLSRSNCRVISPEHRIDRANLRTYWAVTRARCLVGDGFQTDYCSVDLIWCERTVIRLSNNFQSFAKQLGHSRRSTLRRQSCHNTDPWRWPSVTRKTLTRP